MNDIHPLKSPILVPLFATAVPYVLLVLGVLALFLLVMWLRNKRAHAKMSTVAPTPIPDKKDIIARYQSMLNEQKQQRTTMTPEEYFLQVTNIIKSCIDELYQMPITRLTTFEISQLPIFSGAVKQAIMHFLQNVDYVKFADTATGNEVTEKVYTDGQQVLETLLQEVTMQDADTTQTVTQKNI